jgi:hypothetical protein
LRALHAVRTILLRALLHARRFATRSLGCTFALFHLLRLACRAVPAGRLLSRGILLLTLLRFTLAELALLDFALLRFALLDIALLNFALLLLPLLELRLPALLFLHVAHRALGVLLTITLVLLALLARGAIVAPLLGLRTFHLRTTGLQALRIRVAHVRRCLRRRGLGARPIGAIAHLRWRAIATIAIRAIRPGLRPRRRLRLAGYRDLIPDASREALG